MATQTQPDICTLTSLLPYLARNGQPTSRLSLTYRQPANPGGASYPFCVLNDSGPVTRLLEAAFVTDSGNILKKVFLLLTKDRYAFQEDSLWPVTNSDIDTLWQQAFSFHDKENGNNASPAVLSAQTNGNGALNLLAPLFFCKEKETYFHPPCPVCGMPLQLCRDDNLLGAFGLQPYSTSLKRYLYCAPCRAQGITSFYVNEHEHDDPPLLKDRRSLISAFGLLKQSRDLAGPFPCLQCAEYATCYSPGGAAQTRIVPLSFYPFYLLIFDALPLNALEFLPLVSGATFEELENRLAARNGSGRRHCLQEAQREGLSGASFYTAGDKRYFPEILYLKLSFLDSVLHQFLAQPDIPVHPDMRPTIDRVWVNFQNLDGILPSFWNFRTRVIDIACPSDVAHKSPTGPSSNLLFYLGLLWFHALLVNKKQDVKSVFLILENGLAGVSPDSSLREYSDTAFAPENIFWDPNGKNVARDWHPLWENALALGLRLVRSATGHGQPWAYETFFQDLGTLRTDVRNVLFMERPGDRKEPAPEERHSEKDVCAILTDILGKWREKQKAGTTSVKREEDIEQMETVILAPPHAAPVPASQPEEFTETVILSSSPLRAVPPAASQKDNNDDPLLETVIITPEMRFVDHAEQPGALDAGQTTPAEPQKAAEDDDTATTIILAPQRRERGKGWRGGHE